MDKVSGKLTVFFEDPFWVGVFERVTKGRLSVSKVTFGAEPKEQEVYAFVLKQYRCLRFSPAVAAAVRQAGHNPKRLQREAHRQTQETGIGTKSQQALQLQRDASKQEQKMFTQEQQETKKTAPFRAAAAGTKGKAPGASISGAFSLLRCALNFRRSGCRG